MSREGHHQVGQCKKCGYLTHLLLCLIAHEEFQRAQHWHEGVMSWGPDHPIAYHALQGLEGPCHAPLEGLASCYHQKFAHCSSALAALSLFLSARYLTTLSNFDL